MGIVLGVDLKASDHIRDGYFERSDSGYYPPSFKRLPFWEGYIKGCFGVSLVFESIGQPNEADQVFCATVWTNNGAATPFDARRFLGRWNLKTSVAENSARGDEIGVLVSDVQLVQGPKVVSAPSTVWLYGVQNKIRYGVGHSSGWFLSMKEGTAARPIGSDWEAREPMRGAVIGFDKFAVAVIKSSPEIVECVSQNGWGVTRQLVPEGLGTPNTLVLLGAEHFLVCVDPLLDDKIKLVDVMFGPINF